MKRVRILLLSVMMLGSIHRIWGTPSSLFWTNCTTDVQPTGTGNIDADNYFTVFNSKGRGQTFPPDIGVLIGVFTVKDFSVEMGFDYLGGTDYPLFFNAKIGIPEAKLFSWSPSFSLGVFDIGTKSGVTNLNVFDVVFGASLPKEIGGNVYIGGYTGNRALGRVRQGYMVGFSFPFSPAKDCKGKEYHKWILEADYASGKNELGGGGVGLSYYFTPSISIQTGPTWFNDAKTNGRWKWSFQVDIGFPIFGNESPEPEKDKD